MSAHRFALLLERGAESTYSVGEHRCNEPLWVIEEIVRLGVQAYKEQPEHRDGQQDLLRARTALAMITMTRSENCPPTQDTAC